HVKRGTTSVCQPVAACMRRRLVAVERNHLVAAADRLSGSQLVVTRHLDLVETRQHLVGRHTRINLLDLARLATRPPHAPGIARAFKGLPALDAPARLIRRSRRPAQSPTFVRESFPSCARCAKPAASLTSVTWNTNAHIARWLGSIELGAVVASQSLSASWRCSSRSA